MMGINPYFDIAVEVDHFRIVESAQKPSQKHSALILLNKIEDVIQKNLQYDPHAHDTFAKLTELELLSKLREISISIREGFLKKKSKFFSNRKRQQVINAYDRIEKAIYPLLGLPNEVIQTILGFLPQSDLENISLLNREANANTQLQELIRARKYGYKDNDFLEAKNYLKMLVQGIAQLIQDEYISAGNCDPEQVFRDLLLRGDDIKDFVNPLLLEYAKKGIIEAVHVLILLGADLETPDKDRNTALALAVSKGHRQVAELLIKNGAAVDTLNKDGHTPLQLSTSLRKLFEAGVPELTQLLLENGAKKSIDHVGPHGTALHYAVGKGEIEIAELLLKHGANPNVLDPLGAPPLNKALLQGHREMAALLFNYGGKNNVIDQSNYHGDPSLLHTIKAGCLDSVQLFIEHGLNVNAQPFLLSALTNSQWEIAALFIKSGADVNYKDLLGNTPLMHTARKGHLDVAQMLLEKGGAQLINHRGYMGQTALHHAAVSTLPFEMVELLLKYGADPDIKDQNGNTPSDLTRKRRVKRLLRSAKAPQ